MSYKKSNSYAIIVAISLIVLALVASASFNHSYMVFAAPKKKTSSSSSNTGQTSGFTLGGGGGGSPSSSSTTTNTNSLTKKELSSFISCVNTANKSQGLTHKVVTNCLDTARGITSSASSGTTATGSPPSIAPSDTSQT